MISMRMEKLVAELTRLGVLKTHAIIEAFKTIDGVDFVLPEYKKEAYTDIPLPIGGGQTISQPYTVAFMLELLNPERGNKIVDVGAGSGWTTALLAHIVGEKGKVFGVERIHSLKNFGEKNILKYNFLKKGVVQFLNINAEEGLPAEAPFDRILSGASAKEIPLAWKNELRVGGRTGMPIRESIRLFVKEPKGKFSEQKFPGFVFVPFVSDKKP